MNPFFSRRRREVGHALTQCSRGAAALEFALTLPVILLLAGGTISFACALHGQALLGDVAGNAVRSCVQQNLSKDQTSACAQATVTQMLTSIHKNICMGSNLSAAQINANLTGAAAATSGGPKMYLLTVALSCPWNFMPLLGAGAAAGADNLTTSLTIHASAAMTFLSVK
jgi:Flp pilus assembly protein TadG